MRGGSKGYLVFSKRGEFAKCSRTTIEYAFLLFRGPGQRRKGMKDEELTCGLSKIKLTYYFLYSKSD